MNLWSDDSEQSQMLDDFSACEKIDSSNLRDRLRELPSHCEAAWLASMSLKISHDNGQITNVVIAGMGGSAIAGDLLMDLAAAQHTVPITVVRDFSLPMKLDSGSLVVVCSYSGETEETMSLYHDAVRQGARILAITSGGRLRENADDNGDMILQIDVLSEPRSAVAYNLILLVGAFRALGVLTISDAEVQRSFEILRSGLSNLTEDVSVQDNPAKQLALLSKEKLLVIYGGGIFAGMARRWKSQINENSKSWAFYEVIPELLHNSIESLDSDQGIGHLLLLLRPNGGDERLQRRYEVLQQLFSKKNTDYHMVGSIGDTPLGQMLDMLVLGDYFSYYLALIKNIDPSPNPVIDLAKSLNK
ncbi:MAG: bifunctional phosphoglucose/phosphomannose isomerase [Chloroflexota bacterium]|nr:bifunctional phosphoglucose/phosphomannose isomerase [Chloroflexota bacterium]